jgi:hypothetical protein
VQRSAAPPRARRAPHRREPRAVAASPIPQAELRATHESARSISAAVASLTSGVDVAVGEEAVPEWKLREFEDLRNAVATMWEQLDVPAEEVTAFLSECDLLAPFSPRVLEMYQDMYRRLTNAASAAAVAAAAPAGSPAADAARRAGAGGAYASGSATAAALQARAEALADQYAEASAAASARAQAAVAGMAAQQLAPAPAAQPRSAAAAGRAAAAGSRGAGAGAFRATSLSAAAHAAAADEDAYLRALEASAHALPPSMGGPGARTPARG